MAYGYSNGHMMDDFTFVWLWPRKVSIVTLVCLGAIVADHNNRDSPQEDGRHSASASFVGTTQGDQSSAACSLLSTSSLLLIAWIGRHFGRLSEELVCHNSQVIRQLIQDLHTIWYNIPSSTWRNGIRRICHTVCMVLVENLSLCQLFSIDSSHRLDQYCGRTQDISTRCEWGDRLKEIRNVGALPITVWWTRRHSLNCMRTSTGSQCSSIVAAETWSRGRRPYTSLTAALRTHCSAMVAYGSPASRALP